MQYVLSRVVSLDLEDNYVALHNYEVSGVRENALLLGYEHRSSRISSCSESIYPIQFTEGM